MHRGSLSAFNGDILCGRGHITVHRQLFHQMYTFTSKNMIMDPVTFEFRKNIPVANDMLIWGRPGYQTMMTGAAGTPRE